MNLPLDLVFFATGTLCALCAVLWARRGAQRDRTQKALLTARVEELMRRIDINAQNEGRYRSLFDSVPLAIVVSRVDGSLLDINAAGLLIYGYGTQEEAMAVNMKANYVNPAERDRRVAAAMNDSLAKPGEVRMRRRDGTTFPALAQIRVVRDAAGAPAHIESFITDISDYKRLEQDRQALEHEQRISARLQSVGALAAGIAHEINTPMQFVSDSVYFLKTAVGELDVLWPELAHLSQTVKFSDDSARTIERIGDTLTQIDIGQLVTDANDSAERALEGIRRVTKIIRAMREFAHPDNGEHTNVDINNAIETTLTVCKNVYKEVADVTTNFGFLPPVKCQYGEINQVFLNIIVNAAHAIEAQKHVGVKGRIEISTEIEDNWAVIKIKDNGTGIPDSVKARIFDPFFTTKEVGKGTGQGLAIVQSVIVERHRGRITVDSEVGKGTAFILRLPLEGQPVQSTSGVEHEQEA